MVIRNFYSVLKIIFLFKLKKFEGFSLSERWIRHLFIFHKIILILYNQIISICCGERKTLRYKLMNSEFVKRHYESFLNYILRARNVASPRVFRDTRVRG